MAVTCTTRGHSKLDTHIVHSSCNPWGAWGPSMHAVMHVEAVDVSPGTGWGSDMVVGPGEVAASCGAVDTWLADIGPPCTFAAVRKGSTWGLVQALGCAMHATGP